LLCKATGGRALALQASRAGADIELLTAVEFQTLRASEVQRWYETPGFSRFSSKSQRLAVVVGHLSDVYATAKVLIFQQITEHQACSEFSWMFNPLSTLSIILRRLGVKILVYLVWK